MAPISTSRMMPPVVAATNDNTRTPKTSSPALDGGNGAAQRENERADEIQRREEQLHGGRDGVQSCSRSPASVAARRAAMPPARGADSHARAATTSASTPVRSVG